MGKKDAAPQNFSSSEVLKLTRNGIWLADEQEITHEPTRKLFARSLRQDENGYYIEVGHESKRVEIEDTAYFVHRIDGYPTEGFEIWLTDDTKLGLDPGTLRYKPGRLTCTVPKDGKQEEAKFLHPAYFDLLQHLQEDKFGYYLEILMDKFVLSRK